MKKSPVLMIVILVLLFGGAGAFLWLITTHEPVDNPFFICGYPPLLQVRQGFSKDDVVKVLGPPTEGIDKSKTLYSFSQGEYERKIREGWIYKVNGWNGSIEVYFGQGGKVLRSNCGVG